MSKIRSIIKRLTQPILNKGLNFYYRKPRKYEYQGIKVMVHPEVFPPHLTLSTKILLDFISNFNLQKKTLLELGCGSGIISLFASKKGATVTASDINEVALNFLQNAAEKNNLEVSCLYSNLFENLKTSHFDYIIINPPYYPKKAISIKPQAWFCGIDFEYFINLFHPLPAYLSIENKTYMILSEDCDIDKIKSIALENNILFSVAHTIKKVGEKNTIFQLSKT